MGCCGSLEDTEFLELNHFMITTLNTWDSMFFVQAPANIVALGKQVMLENWQPGLQEEEDLGGVKRLKFRNNIWRSTGDQKIQARRALCKMIDKFWEKGWIMECCCDLDRSPSDGSDLIFRLHAPKEDSGEMACFSQTSTDRIRIISDHADKLAPGLRQSIEESWQKGIQNESTAHNCPQFKLRGNPWYASGQETVDVRQLIMGILKISEKQGYLPYGSIGMQKWDRTINSLYMKQVPRCEANPAPRLAISMNETDKLRIIPERGASLDQAVVSAVRQAINDAWGAGRIQAEDPSRYGMCHQFKLKGNPWYPSGVDGIKSRVLLAKIFENMFRSGWELNLCTELSKKEADTSSLFFRRARPRKDIRVCCLTPCDNRRFRLLGCPDAVVEQFPEICRQVGLLRCASRSVAGDGNFEWDCGENVWRANMNPNTQVTGKVLILKLFEAMTAAGWFFLDAVDSSKKMSGGEHKHPIDTNSFYFAQEPVTPIHQWAFLDDPPPPYNPEMDEAKAE